jgi:hypothetical protein
MVYESFFGVKRRDRLRRHLAVGRQVRARKPGLLIPKPFRVFFTIAIDKMILVEIAC